MEPKLGEGYVRVCDALTKSGDELWDHTMRAWVRVMAGRGVWSGEIYRRKIAGYRAEEFNQLLERISDPGTPIEQQYRALGVGDVRQEGDEYRPRREGAEWLPVNLCAGSIEAICVETREFRRPVKLGDIWQLPPDDFCWGADLAADTHAEHLKAHAEFMSRQPVESGITKTNNDGVPHVSAARVGWTAPGYEAALPLVSDDFSEP